MNYPLSIKHKTGYVIRPRLEATNFFNSVALRVCNNLINYTDFDSGTEYHVNDYLSTHIFQSHRGLKRTPHNYKRKK